MHIIIQHQKVDITWFNCENDGRKYARAKQHKIGNNRTEYEVQCLIQFHFSWSSILLLHIVYFPNSNIEFQHF